MEPFYILVMVLSLMLCPSSPAQNSSSVERHSPPSSPFAGQSTDPSAPAENNNIGSGSYPKGTPGDQGSPNTSSPSSEGAPTMPNETSIAPPGNEGPTTQQQRKTGSPGKRVGKIVGLLFLGIAGFLQVGLVSFLVFKRWQISGIRDETGVRLVG